MPSGSRRSPRAAIRTWLEKTEQQVETDDPRPAKTLVPDESNTETTNFRSKRRTNAEGSNDGVRRAIPVQNERKGSGAKRAEHEGEQNESIASGVGLAERLGLHAPFRTFADQDTNVHPERRRKKRGRSLSISSLLEPAEEPLDLQDNHLRKAFDGVGTRAVNHGHPPSDIDSPCREPSLSEQPETRYERRLRRKTKEDKYKVKQDADKSNRQRAGREKKKGTDKPNKRRKRNEKSGDALMHTFSAPNVAQERLTIRPAAPVGLFGKGRASSPVRRRGLPDLTFSEMTFLNPRKAKADTTMKQTLDKKRRNRDKKIDAEAQMSRYFTAKNPEKKESGMDHGYRRSDASAVGSLARASGDIDRSASRSSLPPVDLPDRPFLGFGSSGATLTSPVRVAVHPDPPSRRSTRSESRSSRRSSIGSSSYYSWSTSAPSRKDVRHLRKDLMLAAIGHGVCETLQAHSPSPQRPQSRPNKKIAVEPQEATERGLHLKQQIVVDNKPASMLPDAAISLRIEPEEEELSCEKMPGPKEAVVQETRPEGNSQTRSHIASKQDGPSKTDLKDKHRDHLSIKKPRHGNESRFPYSFDTAFEDLLKTCNVSLNRREDLKAASMSNQASNQTQSQGSLLATNEGGQNADVTDQIRPPTSDRTSPVGQASNSQLGAPPPTFKTAFANANAKSDLLPPQNERNSPPNRMPKVSELEAHPSRTQRSAHKPTGLQSSLGWQQNEQEQDHASFKPCQGSLPSGAWHGYQALYENQVFPDDGVDGHLRYVLDAEDQGHQDEQEWFQHHAIDTEEAEPEYHFEGTDDSLFYDQHGQEASYIHAHDWEPTTYPPYNEFDQFQPVDDNDIDFDARHRSIYRFSDSGYGRSTIASAEGPYNPVSALGRPNDNPQSGARGMQHTPTPHAYDESINHRWRPTRMEDDNDIADFWRPNKLY